MIKLLKSIFILLLCLLASNSSLARNIDVNVEPGNWWVGMKNDTITLLANGPFEGKVSVSINHTDVKLINHFAGDNPQYQFIVISISANASASIIPIKFSDTKGNNATYFFSLDDRTDYTPTKLTGEDIMYQIIPDRFCNGDTKNDFIKGYYELSDRLNPSGIHGGDLAGITSKLNYISEIGFTCIDLLPVYESNLMSLSYQRNGVTDHYAVDKRLGDNKDYIQLIYKCHEKDLKVAQTMVFHQVGQQHPWFITPPLNAFFTHTTYEYDEDQNPIPTDPYASHLDQQVFEKQWDEINMPSLNQNSKIVQDLLIQHCIWWIETAQIDILKISHIDKNNPEFLKRLFKALNTNFPDINIISDSSPNEINTQFCQNLALKTGIDKHQIHICDYQLTHSLADAFSTFRTSNEGLEDLYSTIVQDQKYINPMGNIIMADNYQTSRLFSNADKEFDQAKMMTGFILTMRGIPSILYGTEYLLDGTITNGNSFVRKDFPNGGWETNKKGNTQNLSYEKEEYNTFIKRIVKWRKNSEALFSGRLLQFSPQKGVYAYCRITNTQAAFIFINNTDKPIYIDQKKYKEVFSKYRSGYDVIKDDRFDRFDNLLAEKKSITILHLTN